MRSKPATMCSTIVGLRSSKQSWEFLWRNCPLSFAPPPRLRQPRRNAPLPPDCPQASLFWPVRPMAVHRRFPRALFAPAIGTAPWATTLVIKGVTEHLLPDPQGRIYSHRHPAGYWLPGGASNTGGEALARPEITGGAMGAAVLAAGGVLVRGVDSGGPGDGSSCRTDNASSGADDCL